MVFLEGVKEDGGYQDSKTGRPGLARIFQASRERVLFSNFPTTDATLLRDGDNLVINFPDGAQISLQDFTANMTRRICRPL